MRALQQRHQLVVDVHPERQLAVAGARDQERQEEIRRVAVVQHGLHVQANELVLGTGDKAIPRQLPNAVPQLHLQVVQTVLQILRLCELRHGERRNVEHVPRVSAPFQDVVRYHLLHRSCPLFAATEVQSLHLEKKSQPQGTKIHALSAKKAEVDVCFARVGQHFVPSDLGILAVVRSLEGNPDRPLLGVQLLEYPPEIVTLDGLPLHGDHSIEQGDLHGFLCLQDLSVELVEPVHSSAHVFLTRHKRQTQGLIFKCYIKNRSILCHSC